MAIATPDSLLLQRALYDMNLFYALELESEGIDQAGEALAGLEKLQQAGLLAGTDLPEIRRIFESGSPQVAFGMMRAYRDVVETIWKERHRQAADQRIDVLDRLNRIIGVRSDVVHPSGFRLERPPSPIPTWAQELSVVIENTGERRKLRFNERGYAVIGRDERTELQIDDEMVSAKHAILMYRDGECWIRDLETTNGTSVNDVGISSWGWTSLGSDPITHRIEVGGQRLELHLPSLDDPSGFPDTERSADLYEEHLRGEIKGIRDTYLPGFDDDLAFKVFDAMAEGIARAVTVAEVVSVLRTSPLLGSQALGRGIQTFFTGKKARKSFKSIPEFLRLREKATKLAQTAFLPKGVAGVLESARVSIEEFVARPWEDMEVPPTLAMELEHFERFFRDRLQLDAMEKALPKELSEDTGAIHLKAEQDAGRTTSREYNIYQQRDPAAMAIMDVTERDWGSVLLGDFAWRETLYYANSYWLFGGDLEPANSYEGQIYLSLDKDYAAQIWEYLTQNFGQSFQNKDRSVQFRMTHRLSGFQRADSSVIYFHARDQEAIYDRVVRMAQEYPEFFKEGTPIFTLPLSDPDGNRLRGIAFGQEPDSYIYSFGSFRIQALSRAIRIARIFSAQQKKKMTWARFRQIVAYCLDQVGVDIQHPAFDKEGRRNFPIISFHGRFGEVGG